MSRKKIFKILPYTSIIIIIIFSIHSHFYFQRQIEKNSSEILKISQENSILKSSIFIIEENLNSFYSEFADKDSKFFNLLENQNASTEKKIGDLERRQTQSEVLISNSEKILSGNLVNISDKIELLTNNSKENIIEKWSPFVVQVNCDVNGVKQKGSGVFFGYRSPIDFGAGNQYVVLTNEHVLTGNGDVTQKCEIVFTEKKDNVILADKDSKFISTFSGLDISFLTIDSPDSDLENINSDSLSICKSRLSIGEDILIFGYPKIGSDSGLTITEGIISGYDGVFYITSAKLGVGNSGGAAISISRGCYLGIPTLSKKGAVESLGRILDVRNIIE